MRDNTTHDAMGKLQRSLKRFIDIVAALVGIVLFSPLFLIMSSVVEEEGPQLVAKCDDTNSTRLEQFLRGHHLDELPQLWNVLKGDMSLVGPRPERKFFIDKIMEHTRRYPIIYQMRPGLTSEATLYNGYTDTMEKMIRRMEMDIHYLEHRSLWTDSTIVTKTVLNIVTGKKF